LPKSAAERKAAYYNFKTVVGTNMRLRLLALSVCSLALAGCADKQKYEETVLEEMKKEKDVQDYKIDPEHMAKCVIDTTYERMPGLFPFDPNRMTAYRNYTKMLTLSLSKEPQKTLEELRKDFGSPQELAKAHSVYTESIMDCYSAILQENEQDVRPDPNTKG
jgi:hypothetical protein